MFNKLKQKTNGIGRKLGKKVISLLVVVIILAIALLLSADQIEKISDKYSAVKNQATNKTSSLSSTLAKVNKLSEDINNSIKTINSDLDELRGKEPNENNNQVTETSGQQTNNNQQIDYRNSVTADKLISFCLENGIDSADDCLIKIKDEIIENKNIIPVECIGSNIDICGNLISKIISSEFIDKKQLDEIKTIVKNITSSHIEVFKKFGGNIEVLQEKSGKEKILTKEESKSFQEIFPVLPQEDESFLVLSSDYSSYDSAMPGVLMNDDDKDGLPNEMEIRLGTDPKEADTDGDGYSDFVEIQNDYNPNGTEKIDKQLSPVEKAIINKKVFEQPLFSEKKTDNNLSVEEIKNKKSLLVFNDGLEIKGKAEPNQTISLYIYSAMPIVITIKTDANGNWIYNFDKKLIDGNHKAYVVINNDKGEIEKQSTLFNFFVKNAIAVDSEAYLKEKVNIIDRTKLMILVYVLSGVLLIVLLLIVFVYQIKSLTISKVETDKSEAASKEFNSRNYSMNDLDEILKRNTKK